MKLTSVDAKRKFHFTLNQDTSRIVGSFALGFLSFISATALQPPAQAITLDIEYSDEGDTPPQDGNFWNTLGVAEYRAGNWNAAIKALEKSMELGGGGSAFDWLFLSMGHQQLGHHDEVRRWYDRAAEWMDANAPNNAELARFRAEAAELLGITQRQPSADQESPNDQPQSTNTPASASKSTADNGRRSTD